MYELIVPLSAKLIFAREVSIVFLSVVNADMFSGFPSFSAYVTDENAGIVMPLTISFSVPSKSV